MIEKEKKKKKKKRRNIGGGVLKEIIIYLHKSIFSSPRFNALRTLMRIAFRLRMERIE